MTVLLLDSRKMKNISYGSDYQTLTILAHLWQYTLYMKLTTMTISMLCFGMTPLHAQTAWTMDQCMAYAVEHSTKVQVMAIGLQQAKSDCKMAKLSFLPKVDAQISGQYSWGRNIDPETNNYNNVTTFNNYYELSASLPLFDDFATLNSFRQARLARSNSETALQQSRDELAMDVMQAYVDACYAHECIRLAREKRDDSKTLLHKTRRLFELGEKSRPDVAQIEAQVAEDDYNLIHQLNEWQKAMLKLKSLMNYTPPKDIRITSGSPSGKTAKEKQDLALINPCQNRNKDIPYTSFSSPEENKENVSILLAGNAIRNAKYTYQIKRADLFPSLTLEGEMGTNYYKNLSQGGNTTFAQQWHNNQGEYLVLSLHIPLVSPAAWRSVRKAKNDIVLARISLDEKRRQLQDNISETVMDYNGYSREYSQMEKKTTSDSLAYFLSYRKYEEGMLSAFDLHTASETLLQSRIKRLQIAMLLAIKQRLIEYYNGQPLIHQK